MFSPLPDRLALPEGQLDAWILRVCPGMAESQVAALLSPDELAKGRRFRFQSDRDLCWNARAALRILLGRYLGIPAASIGFVYTVRGRPILEPEHAASGIEFSVSHSGDHVAIAVSRGPVGIDLERDDRQIDVPLMSRYLFSEFPPDEGPVAFLRRWTRTEAYLKAIGAGFGEAPPPVPDRSWIFFDLSDDAYAIAVAARVTECRSYRLEWSGGQLTVEAGVLVFPAA